jgi:phage/plasmid-associated DNA primase
MKISRSDKNYIPRIAKLVQSELKFAKDSGNRLYVYENGVYRPRGEGAVAAAVKSLLTRSETPPWSSHRVDEVVKYILVDCPFLVEHPPVNVLNVQNGILNLKTGKLSLLTPKLLSTVQLPVAFDRKATCPAWEQFVS